MTAKRTINTIIVTAIALFASGCYTQIQTTHHDRPTVAERVAADRSMNAQSAVQERSGEIISEEDYALGYEDGWVDAEAYYFVDYEARDWYVRHGSSVVNNRHFRNSYHWNHSFYGYYGYDPFLAYWHAPFYVRHQWYFGFSFGPTWFRPYHPAYYSWYRYPGYYPYYGYWGYTRPYFGYAYLGGSSSTRAVRNYGPRATHLSSRDARVNRTTRTDARVQQSGTVRSRTDVRSAARTEQVNRSGSTTIRNRTTTTTTSRGAVNRGTSTNRGSSGTVNRGSSTTNRGSGTVNRGSSSTNRSSGTVNRGSSSTSRSSGTVNRNSSSTNRSSGTVNRNSDSQQSSLFAPQNSSSRITTQFSRPSASQERGVESVRNRLLETSGSGVARSTSHSDAIRSSIANRSSGSSAGSTLRTIYNTVQSSGAPARVTSRAASSVSRSSGSSSTVRSGSSSAGRSSVGTSSSGSSTTRSSGSSTSRSRN
ncbi:MAG: hypothetical protein EA360_01790 [Balneolaceae bacterium]|nr:MAG: hypothetical protein EA360_01790 [Balneolaceae bacterium]